MKKGVVVAAALVVAVAAAPAGAAEFSYGGLMRFNYQGGNPGTVSPEGGGTFFGFDQPDVTANVFEYRVRQFFNMKVNDHVTTNVKFEWNSQFGNENALAGGSGDLQFGGSPATGTNELQFRVKHAYLQFDLPNTPLTLTIGQQDFSTPKALINVEDGTGIKADAKLGGLGLQLFWSKQRNGNFVGPTNDDPDTVLDDETDVDGATGIRNQTGVEDAHWFGVVPTLTFGDVTVSGHLSWLMVGAQAATDVYLAGLGLTASDSADVYFFGVDSSGKFGAVGFTADLVFQSSEFDTTTGTVDVFSYIADVSVSLAAGPGTLTLKGLYSPGDDNATDTDLDAWQNIINTDMGWSPFFHDGSDNNDFTGSVLPGVNDGGIIAVGAELALSPSKSLTVTPNAYYLMAAEDTSANGAPVDDFYGVEVGVQALWKVWDAVEILAQFDYLFAGDVFEDPATGDTKDAYRVIFGPRISW